MKTLISVESMTKDSRGWPIMMVKTSLNITSEMVKLVILEVYPQFKDQTLYSGITAMEWLNKPIKGHLLYEVTVLPVEVEEDDDYVSPEDFFEVS